MRLMKMSAILSCTREVLRHTTTVQSTHYGFLLPCCSERRRKVCINFLPLCLVYFDTIFRVGNGRLKQNMHTQTCIICFIGDECYSIERSPFYYYHRRRLKSVG
jgi:hypothetical protein